MDSEPFISVVTPFYNEEKYLSECIESVLNQTYQNFEYILVNNYSKDNSYVIAQNYSKSDHRIRLYSNSDFLTQIKNHNYALSLISPKSKYCKMVLGDDWIFPECIEKMISTAAKSDRIGIVGSYRLYDKWVRSDGLPYPSTIIKGREACRYELNGIFIFGSQTTIMYRSSIVRGRKPFFKSNGRNFDTEVCFDILKRWDFGFVHQVLSFTRRENYSTVSMVDKYEPFKLNRYIILRKYGKYYLTNNEYIKTTREIKNWYYGFLAKQIFSVKGINFWNFHIEGLKTIDEKLWTFVFFKHIILEMLNIILNIKTTISYIVSNIKKSFNKIT